MDRTNLGGVALGDVWPCEVLRASTVTEGDDLIPFHKLTGWTTYSLVEPIEKMLHWKFEGLEDLTGLPEYRNGMSSASVTTFGSLTYPWRLPKNRGASYGPGGTDSKTQRHTVLFLFCSVVLHPPSSSISSRGH